MMNLQRGVALVLVLWVLSLLTIMAGSFALSMRRETAMISGMKNNAAALATAESGLAIAEFMLLNPDVTKRWQADGSLYEIDAPDAKLRIKLLSETGKINLNTAEPALLQKMMRHAPTGSELKLPFATINRANALIDWRDTDDLLNINGAEKQQYQDAGLSYVPHNQPFQTLEELQMVLGMDEATLKWLEPLVTVYSEQSVDLQLASKAVLQVVLDIDSESLDRYILSRAENAKNNLPPPPLPVAGSSSGSINSEVTALTIISEVQLSDQSTAVINALVKKSDGLQSTPFQIVRWQTANNGSLFADNMNDLVVKHYAESEFNH